MIGCPNGRTAPREVSTTMPRPTPHGRKAAKAPGFKPAKKGPKGFKADGAAKNRWSDDKRAAYGQSKLACLMFAYELDRRLKAAGMDTLSVAAHPGVAATNLAQHFPKVVSWLFPLVGQPAASGALPTLYAALGNDIQGGDYCGPKDLRQMRGDPVKVSSNRASRDQAAAKRLWEMSQTWTKMKITL